MAVTTVSQSKINQWRNCLQAYHYKYIEKLSPKVTSRPFTFGGLVHQMLEDDANGDDPFLTLARFAKANEKLFLEEQETYGNIIQAVEDIMVSYFAYWPKKSLTYIRRKGRSAEHKFEIELDKDIVLNGIIDGLGKTPNGLKWLVEHKTFTTLPNPDQRWRNIQSALYIWALRELGWFEANGTIWNYVRSKEPGQPEWLEKSQRFSKSKGSNTLPVVLLRAMAEYEVDPEDDESVELIEKATSNLSEYFVRIHTPINDDTVNLLLSEARTSAREIAGYDGKKQVKTIGRHCDWCSFEPLCRAQFMGADPEFIKEREFVKDKPRDDRRVLTTEAE